jgi:hypothetical protein
MQILYIQVDGCLIINAIFINFIYGSCGVHLALVRLNEELLERDVAAPI